MKKFGTTFLMVYSILILLGCEKKSEYIIEYSTTGCFGDCPVLDIKLIDDKLYYNFIKHNNKKGVFNSNVSKDQKQVINSLVSTLLNEDIKKEYLGDVVDVPATYFRLHFEDGREIKTNYDDYIAPKSLDNLSTTTVISTSSFKFNSVNPVLVLISKSGLN